jgi:hypothetical protein
VFNSGLDHSCENDLDEKSKNTVIWTYYLILMEVYKFERSNKRLVEIYVPEHWRYEETRTSDFHKTV